MDGASPYVWYADSTNAIFIKCSIWVKKKKKKYSNEEVKELKLLKLYLVMGALKANILSWAWAVLILLNPVEVGVFSLAEALPINIGYVDCSLQINAAQTIPLKPWLQHSLTTHNICQVTQVSTQPAWFPSYFTPGL